jgi:hypothetical protein
VHVAAADEQQEFKVTTGGYSVHRLLVAVLLCTQINMDNLKATYIVISRRNIYAICPLISKPQCVQHVSNVLRNIPGKSCRIPWGPTRRG